MLKLVAYVFLTIFLTLASMNLIVVLESMLLVNYVLLCMAKRPGLSFGPIDLT